MIHVANEIEKTLFPLTYPQKSIILTDDYYSDPHISVTAGYLTIEEEIDFSLLEKVLNKMVENHEVLRTSFIKKEDLVYQYCKEYKPFPIEKIKITSNEELDEYASQITFDIYKDPLIKFVLFETSPHHGGIFYAAHHSIMDAWSVSLLIENTFIAYDVFKNNQNHEILEKSSYQSFVKSEKEYLNSEKYEKDKAYWNETFSTPIEYLDLRKNTSAFDTISERKRFLVNHNVADFCKENNLSTFAMFFAAFTIYLGRIYRTKDLTIGTPVLNRSSRPERQTLGMFVSTLPFRTHIDESLTIRQYIDAISAQQMGILRHQKYPYSELLSSYAEKFGRVSNLYDVMFSYQNARTDQNKFSSHLDVTWAFTGRQAESLVVNVSDLGGQGELVVDYDFLKSIFSSEQITSMHQRICSILDQMMQNMGQNIQEIDIVTPEEKEALLNTFNQTYQQFDSKATIASLFEKAVQKHRGSIALALEERTMTYQELNQKVNALAFMLKQKGITNNSVVGLMFYRSFEMIISQLAVLKLGAAYLPIDPVYPKERIEYMLQDSGCHFILKSSSIPFQNEAIQAIDIAEENLTPLTKFQVQSHPDDLAYIIYTSGSTGKPKGVQIKNKNICNTLLWRRFLYHFDEEMHVLQIPSFSFDSSVEDIFTPLISGSKLILLKQSNTNFDISMMKDIIERHDANEMLVVPSFYNVLLNELSEKLQHFKHIIVAGEGFSSALVEKHYELLPKVPLYNEYGPTENSVCSTYYQFNAPDTTVYIGTPISNVKCYVLNEHLKLQPFDTKGELYVSGPGVSDGYIGREDLNKERFLENPFHPAFKMYKTGDIVTINSEGNLTFCERADYQVKYNGYRINLGEIETTISKYLKIPNVIALIKKVNDTSVLTAFIETDRKIDEAELKRNLKKFLTHYMIPKDIITLAKFPATPNGKIDRKALENYTYQKKEQPITPPRDELDRKILKIWENILNKQSIGIDDNIFDIGGDSLSIISIQSALFKEDIKIRSQELFETPTIRSLSDKIRQNSHVLFHDKKSFERIYQDDIHSIRKVTYTPKHVLLTGSTGFLGAHILAELITRYSGIMVHCLIRSKPNKSPKARIQEILNYYFGNKYDLLIEKNIHVIEGDLAREHLGMDITEYKKLLSSVDSIINCASLVKHFGNYDAFYGSNVLSVKNLIDFAKESNATLNHISTTSVSGNFLVKNDIEYDYTENDFYIGQNYLDNVYVRTKFEAEALIFDGQKNGLNANIFRIGNLMPRFSDSKFQINKMDNAYYKRIAGFLELKFLPDNLKHQELEFTPVDYTARAIVDLMGYNQKVFHLLNDKTISIHQLISIAKKQNKDISFISVKEFSTYIHELPNSELLDSFITDMDDQDRLNYDTKITINNTLTNKYLKLYDFEWPDIPDEYLDRFLRI